MNKIIINEKYLHSAITGKIIQGFYTVVGDLVAGLDVGTYKRALLVELTHSGMNFELDKTIKIRYKDVEIGNYTIDILVDNSVIVKITANEKLSVEDERAITNQLKLSELEVGLLLNFCMEGEHKRKVFTNDIKNRLQADKTEINTEITENPTSASPMNKKTKSKNN
jgi:GxxExxY protein